MTKQLRLNFILSSPGKLYITGETVQGFLKVFTLNETDINQIKIGVVGKITIEADENDKGQNLTTFETDFHSIEYTFKSIDLKDDEAGDARVIAFAVPLKSTLPPTVVAREGSIKYQLYASMEEQFGNSTTQIVNTQADISVTNLVDCNKEDKADKKKLVKKDPVPSCLCIVVQPQSDWLEINPRAYVPGDSIKVNAVVYNSSNSTMCSVHLALIQKLRLKYENHEAKIQREVTEHMRGCLLPGKQHNWSEEYLRIPSVPPTTHNKHVHITYKLELFAMRQKTDGTLSPKSLLSVPVFIGNLPWESTLNHFNQLLHGDICSGNLLPIPEQYQEYAGAETCIHRIEGSKFVPSYITYMTERAMENIGLLDN